MKRVDQPAVLHVISQFGYLGGTSVIGGHASSLLTLALAQVKSGYPVTIAATVPPGANTPPATIEGVQFVSIPVSAPVGSIRFALQFARRAADLFSGADIPCDLLHVHSGYADYATATAYLKRRSHRPAIHSFYARPGFSPVSLLPGRRRVLANACRQLDGAVATSRSIAEDFVALRLGIEPTVVRPPVDCIPPGPGRSKSHRRSLGLGPDELVILFVGNLSTTKNLELVLRAFSRVAKAQPRARLVVTTEFTRSDEPRVKAALERAVSELGVIRLGLVEDMPGLVSASDIVTTPFLNRGGPSDYFMIALEAMAAGKPVVTSAVGGMAEVIRDWENGVVVDPSNADALTSAFLTLSNDEGLRQSLGHAARDVARHQFSVERAVLDIAALYRTVLP